MSITAKPKSHPWSIIFNIIFCLTIILSTEFYLGNTQSYFKGSEPSISYFFTQVSYLLANHTNIDPILFWHFTWLGIVLGISGIIGLCVLFSKVRFSPDKVNKFSSIQNIKEHVPIQG